MRAFQFTVCGKDATPPVELRNVDGSLILSPAVTAEAITDAMNHVDIQSFCNSNLYRIYRQVK